MTATWRTVFRFDLPEPPARLTITAWGRRFRVVLARASMYAEGFPTDVVRVEVVGPAVAPRIGTSAPEGAIDVDVAEDLNNDITRVGITAVTPNPIFERASTDSRSTCKTEGCHG